MKYITLLLLIICSGCATLPGTVALSPPEKKDASNIFKKILAKQNDCPCCIDTDVSVSFKKILTSGTIPGYFQAKAPAYVRFEGVNPLGMTETVLATDGDNFSFVNVRQQKGYLGKLNSPKLKRYLPAEFSASSGFYWLIGRFPPGPVEILNIERDREGLGYWADVVYEKGEKRSLVLFTGQEELIYQNLSLNRKGDILARFSYEYPSASNTQPGSSSKDELICPTPERLTIDGAGNGTIIINVNRKYPDAKFSESDFKIRIPNSFEKEIIQ